MKQGAMLMATFLVVSLFSFGARAESETIEEVTGVPGTTIKFVYTKHDDPIAHIVAFPGGKGHMGVSDGFFGIDFGKYQQWGDLTINNRKRLREHGFSVAIVDSPSDKGPRMGGFRESEEHGQNIAAIIERMRQDAEVPVWLFGHSRGTVAAAAQTINLGKDVVQGAVLSASIAAGRRVDTYVEDMELERIEVPVLAMSAANDLCDEWTPKESAAVIGERLVNSSNAKVHYFEGARHHPNPDIVCKNNSAHSYGGVETEAIDFIAEFIKSNI